MSGGQMSSSSSSGGHALLDAEPDVHCLVCTRPFTLDAEVSDSFEALAICRECKATVFSDHNSRDESSSVPRERRRRRRRPMSGFEAFEVAFSHRLSRLYDLATQQDHERDVDSPPVAYQLASSASTPNRNTQRWHVSDDESDGLNYVDSVFGENESTVSFGDYGAESDASVDQHAGMGREIVVQLDSGSYLDTDTDVDPMNAATDQWDSDDQEDVDEDEQSEESDFGDVIEIVEGPAVRRHIVGNPGDYVTARQFEMLLNQFAEDNNNTRRGAPPAAKSIVENLPSVVISANHESSGGVTCPVCKDIMPIRTVARRLPCMHLYHSSCILPWLSYRNTCPVCRYELRTDDLDYEMLKQATTTQRGIHGVELIHLQEPIEVSSHNPEVEETSLEEGSVNEHDSVHSPQQHTNGAWGRHRWLVIAAGPVVSLVGLALVLCFGNSSSNGRRQLWRRSQSTTTAHVDTKRSWWSIF